MGAVSESSADAYFASGDLAGGDSSSKACDSCYTDYSGSHVAGSAV